MPMPSRGSRRGIQRGAGGGDAGAFESRPSCEGTRRVVVEALYIRVKREEGKERTIYFAICLSFHMIVSVDELPTDCRSNPPHSQVCPASSMTLAD